MKERPILFSGPMVRAIIEGRKTQTRRVVKPQPPSWAKYPQPVVDAGWDWTDRDVDADDLLHWPNYLKPLRCPYGVPGDRLWVREAWQAFFADEVPADRPRGPRHTMGIPAQPERESFVFYRADGDLSHPEDGSEALWRPSIHMPRWASRITLEIVRVRVERVQEISEEDALAEGLQRYGNGTFGLDDPACCMGVRASVAYMRLWDSINAKRAPWASNPWVWVIEFRGVE